MTKRYFTRFSFKMSCEGYRVCDDLGHDTYLKDRVGSNRRVQELRESLTETTPEGEWVR